MTDLSGRVVDLEKQLLGLPTQADWNAVQISTSRRFNVIEGELSELVVKFDRLNEKVINLQLYGGVSHFVQNSLTGTHGHVFNDIPSGVIDGSNDIFFLTDTPVPQGSLQLYKNGILQMSGVGNDYTFDTNTIIFEPTNIPPVGSNLLASYTIP